MTTAEIEAEEKTVTNVWQTVCESTDLVANLGVRALINGEQIALFRVQNTLYAINAFDPFSKAAVLSRGIVGDLKGQIVVASPIFKQHFSLATGQCLEDDSVRVKTYKVREQNNYVQVYVEHAQ